MVAQTIVFRRLRILCGFMRARRPLKIDGLRYANRACRGAASSGASCCATLVALMVSPLGAADWISVKSPHIEVITDAGERTGRDLLSRFEILRAVFQDAGIGDSPLPVRAIAFASESEFNKYRDQFNVEGFHIGGDRDYLAMHVGADARRVALHEYVHAVLSHSKIALPAWFEEGTAEFYSNVEVDGAKLRIGERIENRRSALERERWLTPDQLASGYPLVVMRPTFYAESWALVHMLNLAPGWRDGMPRYILALSENRDGFEEAFGKSLQQALNELHGYIMTMHAVSVAGSPAAKEEVRVEKLSQVAAAVARAELALHVTQPALARSLIEQIKEDSREAEAARGEIALAEKHTDQARAHFEKAIAMGSGDAEMWYQYATLTQSHAHLEKVIELDPDFAEAQFLLGERLTDDGKFAEAIAHLREALRVQPRNSFYWHALGFAEVKAGLREDAVKSARRAKATAVTEPQEEMANALIALTQEPAEQQLQITGGIITPPTWQNPKGDTRVEGVLTQVDCDGGFARLHVVNKAGEAVAVDVRHPDKVVLENSPGVQREFACGSQHMNVAVEYFRATLEVTRIEFRP
jgi:Tfp pilus assembly protein PilF